jgi:D-alanyl-D-alanine carboxypeptidase
MIRSHLPDLVLDGPSPESLERRLPQLIEDRCLIAAVKNKAYAGVVALDLHDRQVLACHLDPGQANSATPTRLFKAVEQRALAYGLRKLQCRVRKSALSMMLEVGYSPIEPAHQSGQAIPLSKDLTGQADQWTRRVLALQDELGIPQHYGPRHRLEIVPDCEQRISIGLDVYGREQSMDAQAAAAWQQMQAAAAAKGIELQMVSAYRGLDYQAGIIRSKLGKGQKIESILSVSAAPGFSEHHSGRAIDLKAPGEPPLEASFAETSAYQWLHSNAGLFGFSESFGRNNRHGLTWEPWHWCFRSHH